MIIKKFTMGMGDRFAHQGKAQLQAVIKAQEAGLDIYPTWNKSFREHSIVKSQPQDLRAEADDAVAALGWDKAFYVDADHIGLKTVDSFITGSNFNAGLKLFGCLYGVERDSPTNRIAPI